MLKKQIVEYNDFGHINVKLKEKMEKEGVTIYELSNKCDIRYQTIKNLIETDKITRLDFNVLSKLCYVFDCTTGDMIEYIPPTPKKDK